MKYVRFTSSRTTGTSKRVAAKTEEGAAGAGSRDSGAGKEEEEMDPTRGRFEGSSRGSEGAWSDVRGSPRADNRLFGVVETGDSKYESF